MKEGKKRRIQTEDATKYGEFVCSYFNWVSLEKQKEVADELEAITKEDSL